MTATVKLTPEMQRLIAEQRLGFVASVCEDGTPNLSPKGTVSVWDDEHLLFADICSPGTVNNLRARPTVEINVVDPIIRKGYRFKGSAMVYQEGPIFERGVAFFRQRGSRSPITSIVLVHVERALPLLSPAYDQGMAEEEVRLHWLERWCALYGLVLPAEEQRVTEKDSTMS